VIRLDGDELREVFPATGFSRQDRLEHVIRAGALASHLEQMGTVVIASLISPDKEARLKVRKACRNFKEVYLSTPLEICEKRDPKGLYAKARRGEIKNMVGIHESYEVSAKTELVINTAETSEDEAVTQILKLLPRFRFTQDHSIVKEEKNSKWSLKISSHG